MVNQKLSESRSTQFIEAVPNVSVGADKAAVDHLVSAAIKGGAFVAHVDTSVSANRTVITLFGTPATVVASCSALITTAATTIDMRTHIGCHPCVGAVDVAPFIPCGTATMKDATDCAEQLAAWAAANFHLPCFLYGTAARQPDHQSLPELRRGGLRGLATRLEQGMIKPDFGPPTLHPTLGALITGARDILIAYNVQLSTSDIRVASQIAAAIRTAGPLGRPSALPALRAIGWYEEAYQCAEVSCNLLDYRTTSLRAVWDAVAQVALTVGCQAISSDIIGLVPQAALEEQGLAAPAYIKHIGLDICREFELEKRTIESALKKVESHEASAK